MMWPKKEPEGRVAATRLSRRGLDLGKISGVLPLAWRSLLLLSMTLGAGSCIVADPPEYRAPGQTRPVLNVYSAVPTATRILVVYTNKVPTQFTVQVRSEDAGDELRGVFFLDYQVHPGESPLNGFTLPASTYDNTGREASFAWTPVKGVVTDGCHFVSLIVAHSDSFLSNDNTHLDPRRADDDAAIVTWTVNVNPPPDMSLVNCPTNALPAVP